MNPTLRSFLLTISIIFCAVSSGNSQSSWSLFRSGGKGSAGTRYSIVEEYKEAYRPRTRKMSFGPKKKAPGHHYSRTHRTRKHW